MTTTQVDLVVIGAGAGGMTAAVTAAVHGLNVVLLEKSEVVGGTMAVSAGSVWVPNSHHAAGKGDSPELTRRFLRATVGNRLRPDLCEAFLAAAPEMVAFLEKRSAVRFRAYPHHPDYLATADGATLSGRVLEPVPYDGRRLGGDFRLLRDPLPEFTLLGGMMIDRTDIGHLLNASRSFSAARHAVSLVGRFVRDRLRHHRGTRLVMGNALAGRLLESVRASGARLMTRASVTRLLRDDGLIHGVEATIDGEIVRFRARRGVVLATGGFSRHPDLRRSLMPEPLAEYSPIVPTATGDGVSLGLVAGGRLGEGHAASSFWAPVSVRLRRDGSTAVFPHFVLDRGKPGLIAVDSGGRRFVNEATTYHLFGQAMYAAHRRRPAIPCLFICDDRFIRRYGLGMVRPRGLNLRAAIADGYVTRASTLEGLAEELAVPADALLDTVARNNGFAATGIDEDFGKGNDAYQRNLGDASHAPNPCLGPLDTPPFYAIRVFPGDIGASIGLRTDSHARVLGPDDLPVDRLYAVGNDMDSMMAGVYPAPGITLGPAMTFGYVAAMHAVRASA